MRDLFGSDVFTESRPYSSGIVVVAAVPALCFVAYVVLRSVYRLYFPPLAKFPGPRKAALSTSWLLAQQKTGRPEQIFEELHNRENAHAVRIGPNELHIDDVHLYNTIYNRISPFPKEPGFYAGFQSTYNVFTDTDLARYKQRKKLLNPFFSKQAIKNQEPLLLEKAYLLAGRLRQLAKVDNDCHIYNACRCLTADIISTFTSGEDMGLLRDSNREFHGHFHAAFDASNSTLWDMIYRPTMREIVRKLPRWFSVRISSTSAAVMPLIDHSILAVQDFKKKAKVDGGNIYSVLKDLPEDEAVSESVDILVAGSDTTAYSLAVGFFHICSRPEIKKRLVETLQKAFPDPARINGLKAMEELPYLNACTKESVRVAKASPGRLPRIVPPGTHFVVDGKVVPPGTTVGMSAYTMHNSKELWGPDATEFNPDRWLAPDSKTLDQYMVAFSKGTRSCMGQNLALAEILVTFAVLFRNFDFTLSPKSMSIPEGIDRFTTLLPEPGVLLKVMDVA
ncbi:cytochrome P450 [Periconia macrospinosa]|uniref:Cytochrome P450 n=1 Tax=Periconia macrospinosa TaxID=97972 RepID=A0A2V1DVS9_9PLEO|nr:cytochrome P450 [Periconia macrospinosa]